ncbi:GNAT family N-acetyltransferase [Aquimarina litoralis]|uniref:GNAT family N-acetyltransferase n=1 Tax=Aquimarina litoralis TaxID=584605 RepID=UPI001C58FE76|nr:N-acetyltransferase [Aquimarina litoralis]MBW1297876.1 GNAT family N-acetyltransferase [Aquimarina litoralis]
MIRPYTPNDTKELVEVLTLNIPTYFDPKEIYDFKNYLTTYGSTYFTIESDQIIIGGVGYNILEEKNVGQITWIFFHPDYAGKGFGKRAVTHCLSILKSNSEIKKVTVRTSQLAYSFFEKFGFTLKRIEKDYWGLGLDLYEMELKI